MKTSSLVLSLATLVAALIARPAAASPSTLRCEGDAATAEAQGGALRGSCEDGVAAFKGIPYAAPPVGELRLRDPQPAAPWEGERDATAFGPVCPQLALMTRDGASEDCLSLNVWAPEGAEGLPVMVWIHGGAYLLGASSQSIYGGQGLAALGDVVVVTLNYRLGMLGYLAADALSAESPEGTSGNYGVRDQLMALTWVRDNIAAFGGDPGNVTVFGESAGGGSICALLGAPAADGLFHKAIIQSGPFCTALPEWETATRASPPVKETSEALIDQVGCGEADDVAACLRALPVEAFVDAVEVMKLLFGKGVRKDIPTAPYVDGALIPRQPVERLAAGEVDIPLIVGTTREETSLFFASSRIPSRRAVSRKLEEVGMPEATAQEVMDLYPREDYRRGRWAFLAMTTDLYFACPTEGVADAAWQGAPVYLYEIQKTAWPTRRLRSHHGVDLPFTFGVFDVFGIRGNKRNRAFATQLELAWSAFARDGEVKGWPAYHPGGDALVLDDVSYVAGVDALRGGRCAPLEGILTRAEGEGSAEAP